MRNWLLLLARTSLLFCVVLVYWVLLNALDGIQKQAVLQKQLNFEIHLLECQIKKQKKYSQLMMENAEQQRRKRHDLQHQLAIMQGLSWEDNASSRQYVEALFQAIPVAPKVYYENQAVNAIVSHYAPYLRNRRSRQISESRFRRAWSKSPPLSCAWYLEILWETQWKPVDA